MNDLVGLADVMRVGVAAIHLDSGASALRLVNPVRTLVALTSAPGFEMATKKGPVLTHVTVQAPDMPNAWVHSAKLVTNTGHTPTLAQETAFLKQFCLPIGHASPPASGLRAGQLQEPGVPPP
jgi:hypothetical protein